MIFLKAGVAANSSNGFPSNFSFIGLACFGIRFSLGSVSPFAFCLLYLQKVPTVEYHEPVNFIKAAGGVLAICLLAHFAGGFSLSDAARIIWPGIPLAFGAILAMCGTGLLVTFAIGLVLTPPAALLKWLLTRNH